jgi:SAM-dependent methyltransferase
MIRAPSRRRTHDIGHRICSFARAGARHGANSVLQNRGHLRPQVATLLTKTMSQTDRDYVLGTHDQELQRLGLQHQLWRGQAYALWERARFAPGKSILDVGCGPGFGTLDLAQLVGPAGRVVGVDVSAKFLDFFRSRAPSNVTLERADVQAMTLPASQFDGAYARWVMCFLPRPQDVIDRVAAALKPGGTFAIQDYYNYAAIKLAPQSNAFDRVVRAVVQSWRGHDGDPDVGCRFPAMLSRAGLRVTHLQPILRLATPRDPLWQWPHTFFKIFVPSLVEQGLLTADEQHAFERDWQAHCDDPHAFFTSPPMVEVVAVKG